MSADTGTSQAEVKLSLQCSACAKAVSVKPTRKGNARPPLGWKRVGEAVYCKDCKGKLYTVRALTLPVKDVEGDWREFVTAVYQHIRAAVRLANWSTRQLAMGDTDRAADQAKLHRPAKLYLYGLWSQSNIRGDWPGSAGVLPSLPLGRRIFSNSLAVRNRPPLSDLAEA